VDDHGTAGTIDLPVGAELAYSGLWTPCLRHQTIFRELQLTEVTDEIVADVGELSWLKVLHLRGEFTDVSALCGLTGLATLGLDSNRLQGLILPRAPLTVLHLTGDSLPDSALAGLPDLELLRFSSATATGQGLAVLPPGIRMLSLRLPRLEPSFLAALTQVETLVFAETRLDVPLAHVLAGLAPTLTQVEFLGVRTLEAEPLAVLHAAGIRTGSS
jgi:hypothetical protein